MPDRELFQEHAVLVHRVEQLERKVDKIDATQDTIRVQVAQINDSIESMTKGVDCMRRSMRDFQRQHGPLLADLAEAKTFRQAVRKAWIIAGGVGVATVVWNHLGEAIKVGLRIKGGG